MRDHPTACPLCDGSGAWRETAPSNPQKAGIGRGIRWQVWHEANRLCTMFHDGRYTYDALQRQFAAATAEAARLREAHPSETWRADAERLVIARASVQSHLQPLLEEVGFDEGT